MATKAQKRERGRLKAEQENMERAAENQASLQEAQDRRKIAEDVRYVLKAEQNGILSSESACQYLCREATNYGNLIRLFEEQDISAAQERKVREWAKFRETLGNSPHGAKVAEAFWNARRIQRAMVQTHELRVE